MFHLGRLAADRTLQGHDIGGALLPRVAASLQTVERLWTAIGEILTEFTPTQCANFFAKAGYDPD
jgi:hypothetical protein